jgi:carbon storage regulator
MLVLSRVTDQSIQVGETLVTVTQLTKDKVTLELSGDNTGTHKLKKNESIKFEPDCTIVVIEVRSSFTGADKKVRLGVEAPREVPVHRKEVYDAIKRNEAQEP